MGEIIIKLENPELVNRINDLAREHKRTPEKEARSLLRNAIYRIETVEKRVSIAQNIAERTPVEHNQTNSTDLVREDRFR